MSEQSLAEMTEKERQIWRCIHAFQLTEADITRTKAVEELRNLAISKHGLINDQLRKNVWPILLNVEAHVRAERLENPEEELQLKSDTEWKKYIKEYADKRQVEVDVARSLY